VTGFIDLPTQSLPFFRRQPALACAIALATGCALCVLALLRARVGLGRLLRRVVARVAVRVALLRQPVRGAS
jgi:hypothetical protein